MILEELTPYDMISANDTVHIHESIGKGPS